MKISCPKCPAVYELDESRIPAAGLSIKCPKCQTPFTVAKPKPGEALPPVPLPSSRPNPAPAASKPAPALVPSAPPPGRPPGAQGAVPLPGSSSPNIPRAASAPIATPPPAPAQPGAEARVPLPGQAQGARPPPAPGASQAIATPPPPSAVPLPAGARAATNPRMAPAKKPPPSADPFADLDLNDTNLDNGPPLAPPPAQAKPPPAAPADDPFGLDLPPSLAKPPPPQQRGTPAGGSPALLPDDGGLSFDFIDDPKKAGAGSTPPKLSPAPPPASAAGNELLDFVDEPAAGASLPPPPGKGSPPVMGRGPAASRPPPVMSSGATAGAASPSAPPERVLEKPAEPPPASRERKPRPAREPLGPKVKDALGPAAEKLAAAGQWLAQNRKVAALAAGGLVLVVVLGLGVRAASSESGLFWMNKLLPRALVTASGRRAIEQAQEKLGEGNFLATRSALGTAAEVLQVSPKDEDVRAFYVLCASELKLMYNQAGVDWDVTQHTIDKLATEKPRTIRARAAFALATGDAARAKALLQPLIDRGAAEAEGIFLYSQALLRLKDYKGAAAALDNALKIGRDPPGKLLLARAQVSKQIGELAEAAGFLQRTLERQPTNGRAMIELADVKRAQDDWPGAMALLDKALSPEQKKSLDASEEARALLFKGQILAAQRQNPAAESAFERAVELDPQSPDVRGIYGTWRAGRHEYDRALKHLEVALNKDPTNPKLIDPAVRSLIGVGRPLDASKRVAEGLKKSPEDPGLHFLQGKVDEQFAKPDDAFKDYELALKKRPDHAESLVASGFYLLNVKSDREGAARRLALAAASPDGAKSAVVQLAIGDLTLALGDAPRAKEHYAKALAIDPDDAQAHASMGRALARMDDLKGARAELEIALKTLENDPPLLYEYGSLLRREGDRAGALAPLQKAVKLGGNDFRFHARLGALLFEQGKLNEAEAELKQAALLGDRWSETFFFLGRTLAAKKQLPEAIEQHRRALEIDPDNAEFHYWLGIAFESTSQIGDAIREFATAAEKNPKMALAYEHVGKNYLVQNVYDDAIKNFKMAAQLSPDRPDLLAMQADAEQQAGRNDPAIAHYREALAKNPKLPGVWSKLGVALKDKACAQCRGQAVQAFQRAETVDPHDPSARRELGYVYKEDGKRNEAIAEFKKYIELKPDAADLDQVKDDIYYLSEEKKRSP